MFSCFRKNKEQKKLYYQIDQEFKKSDYEEKISGVYAIYNNDICLYVGQSKNIASRLATHLCGKYKLCSHILVFPTIEAEQELISLEKFTMCELKPIDNILVDFTEKVCREDIAEGSIMYGIDRADCYQEEFNILDCSEFTILNTKHDILICCDIHLDLYENDNMLNFLSAQINKVKGVE